MTTKQIILHEAGELFMERGFQATSTREIAEKAEITQPNLYYHFKTKEDIYIAVLEELSSEVKETLDHLVDQSTGDLVTDLIYVMNYLRERHPINFSIMSHDMTYEVSKENHLHLYRIWQEAYMSPLVHLFNRYIDKEKSEITAEELARYYYSAMAPFMQKDNNFHKEVSGEKIVDLFVYGILDRKDRSENNK